MLFTGFLVKAQDTKPSKAQTIAYINELLKENIKSDLYGTGIEGKYLEHDYRFKDRHAGVEIADNLVILKSHSTLHHLQFVKVNPQMSPPKITQISHDAILNKVEEIRVVVYKSGIGLFFKEQGGNEVSKTNFLPLWAFQRDLDVEKYKETQIYKAFEHLRKLCGAPETLKF